MRLSIQARIFLAVVLIQLVSGALIVGWYFYTINAELRALSRRSAEDAVLRTIAATKDYFGPPAAIAGLTQSLLAGGVLDPGRPEQLERFFLEQLRRSPSVAGLFVGYPDGAFHYVSRSDEASAGGTRTKSIAAPPTGRTVSLTWRDRDLKPVRTASDPADDYDPRTRTWYAAASAQHGLAWTDPYVFFTAREPGITAAIPVTAGDRAVAAVVGVDVAISAVSRFLAQVGLSDGGTAFIVARDGDVIAHSRDALVFPAGQAAGEALRFRKAAELAGVEGAVGAAVMARAAQPSGAAAATVQEQAFDGRDYFVATGGIGDDSWPWRVVAIVPAAGILRTLHASNLLLVGVVLLTAALAAFVGYLVARGVGRPLASLHRDAQLARRGNFEMMEETATGDREIDETREALRALARQQRGHQPPG